MKNILFTLVVILLSFGVASAQKKSLESTLQKIDQTTVTSGIIYDRVLPLADLSIFNMPAEKPHNTADFRFFKQALFELHKASNKTKLVSIAQLEKLITSYNKEMNVVPIGIINSSFQTLNFNPNNPRESGLILKDSLFEQIVGKKPFFNGHALVVAPLKNVMKGEKIVFKFSENLIFNNSDSNIKTLVADFGNGQNQLIIENGRIIRSEVIIENFKIDSDKTFHFTVELFNDFTFNTNGKIFTVFGNASRTSNIQPIACSTNPLVSNVAIDNFAISYTEAEVPFQGLNETMEIKAQIQPRVFYHTNNGNTQKLLLKPILIVDGFDPSDTRKIDDCDCEQDPICKEEKKDKATGFYNPDNHPSFVESMMYTDNTTIPVIEKNLIKVLREKGYDVILVNMPNYTTTTGAKVDGGADFIERNARAFAKLVQEVNIQLQANGSPEKLALWGQAWVVKSQDMLWHIWKRNLQKLVRQNGNTIPVYGSHLIAQTMVQMYQQHVPRFHRHLV